MQTIIVLAPTGQVGFEVTRAIAPLGQLFTLSRAEVDFTDTQAVAAKVAELKPTVIINAAAWTAVDKAETEQHACALINVALPAALAEVANQCNAWLVHYSSDYVYPGNGTTAWLETDATGPLSVYGQSKLDGDLAVIKQTTKHIIFRTSWVYAARGTNFLRTILKLARQREALNVVADQIGAPTPARLIAQVTVFAVQQILQLQAQDEAQSIATYAGVYHLAPAGYCSWYDFAAEIFRLARHSGIELALKEQQFAAITTADYPTPAQRPANSRLNLTKLEQTFNLQMPTWQQQLHFTFNELQAH